MIDIKLLTNDFSRVCEALRAKNIEQEKLDLAQNLILKYKESLKNLESLRATQNAKSKDFFTLKKQGKNDESLQNDLANLKSEISRTEADFRDIEAQTNALLMEIPNIIDDKTPIGADENDNVEIAKFGEIKAFDFAPKPHYELGEGNKWIDFECAVKLAKSRFSLLRGGAAKLNRALINFMLDHNAERGFEEISTPVIVNRDSLLTTGQLPKFENDMFKIASFVDTSAESPNPTNDLYLISTAEITLTNMYRDCIIPFTSLPIKLCAYTPCFRKEAGSAGRDTRGMIRQHQFDKVELVAITAQENSDEMQDFMLKTACGILDKLELPYRTIQLCSGDLGFSASNTIDIEVWLPSQNCYREISSVSNTRDFQSRRGKIRYKKDKKNILAHTLNGSSLAVGRTLIAIMENYQTQNGEIDIPSALKKYL